MWLIAEVDTPEVKYTNIFPLSIYSIIPEAAPDGTPYNSARVLVNTAIGNDMGRLRLQFFRENNYSRLIFVYDDGSRGVIEYTAYEGAYAYWLAAGIPADYSEELITNCINLFVDENAPAIMEMFAAQ